MAHDSSTGSSIACAAARAASAASIVASMPSRPASHAVALARWARPTASGVGSSRRARSSSAVPSSGGGWVANVAGRRSASSIAEHTAIAAKAGSPAALGDVGGREVALVAHLAAHHRQRRVGGVVEVAGPLVVVGRELGRPLVPGLRLGEDPVGVAQERGQSSQVMGRGGIVRRAPDRGGPEVIDDAVARRWRRAIWTASWTAAPSASAMAWANKTAEARSRSPAGVEWSPAYTRTVSSIRYGGPPGLRVRTRGSWPSTAQHVEGDGVTDAGPRRRRVGESPVKTPTQQHTPLIVVEEVVAPVEHGAVRSMP